MSLHCQCVNLCFALLVCSFMFCIVSVLIFVSLEFILLFCTRKSETGMADSFLKRDLNTL